MPYTLKTQQIAVKDPDTGVYSGVDILAEQTTEGLLTEIIATGNEVKTDVAAQMATERSDFNTYVSGKEAELDQYKSTTETNINTYVTNKNQEIATMIAEADEDVSDLEDRKQDVADAVAGMLNKGVDNTLTTANVPAESKAVGDLFETIVEGKSTQPNDKWNRLWIKPSANDVEIPTMDEFNDLKSTITELTPTRLTSADFEWTLGKNYDTTGYLANATGFATSGLYKVSPGNIVINISPGQDANSKNITMFVNEFKSGGGIWLKRNRLTSGESVAIGSETTHIRFGFGYGSAESVTITQTLIDTYFSARVIEPVATKSLVDAVSNDIAGKMDKAYYWDDSGATESQGVIASDGTVYNPTASYNGRYISFHVSANTDLLITGYSNSPSYPCIYIAYDDTTSDTKLKGYSTAYTDEPLTITKAGTVYVSGNITKIPYAKEKKAVTSQQIIDTVILSESLESLPAFVVTYKNSRLYVKKRISDSLSICISWSHHGANQLWDFFSIFYVDETPGSETSLDFTNNGTSIVASDTDWFGPYVVQAVNNADGDIPAGNSYNTGGNHRSNNTATGGGITAEETSFDISVNGETITNGFVNRCNEVTVKWTNAVQANNTSKSDGTGRAVLTESWTMRITDDGIFVKNDICPTEDVVIKKYYGNQAYCPTSGMVIYIGGNTRTPTAINTASNSGNKKCREVICYNANFRFSVMVDSIDLGSFDLGGSYSFFTTSGVAKLYPLLIDGTVNASEGEHYYLEGCYKFWGI